MDALWRIELFGWLRAVRGDHVVSRFRTQKAETLLAYLAIHRQRSHPRNVLTEMLWPEEDEEVARERLRGALASLRRQLEPPGVPKGALLIATRAAVELNPAAVTTDVAEFEAALHAAAQAEGGQASVEHLAQAVDLYQGELLPGFYEEWIEPERTRLAEAHFLALRELSRRLERLNDLPGALKYAQRSVATDPLSEEAHHDLMRLLSASGRPEDAIRQYLELERLLEQEIGTIPESGPRELARTLKQRRASSRLPPREILHPPESPAWQQEPPAPWAIGTSARREVGDAAGAVHDPLPPAAETEGRPRLLAAPGGTVTLLLAELILETAGKPGAGAAREECRALLRSVLRDHRGQELRSLGGSYLVAFRQVGEALATAAAALWALAAQPCPPGQETPRVRIALHTGDIPDVDTPAQTPVLYHITRLLLAAHPGQILISEATAGLLRDFLEPGLHLTDLDRYRLLAGAPPERLFQARYPDMPAGLFPPPRAAPAHEGHLPRPLTRFFGREPELERLEAMIVTGDTRLLTLTGSGGSGKTRLGLELAARLRDRFHGAVWFVSMAALADRRHIGDRLLGVLHLPRTGEPEPLERIAAFLSDQPSLLLLDNFEQLIPEGAPTVRMLLERTPSLVCLVTSRRRLNLSGERELVVQPLPAPVERGKLRVESPTKTDVSDLSTLNSQLSTLAAFPSVALFVDRAQAVRPDFQLTSAIAPAVAALCRALEGIPLALELAAARMGVMSPAQLLARLDQRLGLLVSRQRDTDPRHRSLHAALDSSYQLLSPELQRFFARLSVFRGGWTLAAAEAVCEEPRAMDYLQELRECSMMLVETPAHGEPRLRMLETLREYAAEQLSAEQREQAERRHARYYVELADVEEADSMRPCHDVWLDRVTPEIENVRAAFSWAEAQKETETALRLATATYWLWRFRGSPGDARLCLTHALALPGPVDGGVRSRAVRALGAIANRQGELQLAEGYYEESRTLAQEAGDPVAEALAIIQLADLKKDQGESERARQLHEKALQCSREMGHRNGVEYCLSRLILLAHDRGDEEALHALREENWALQRQHGDPRSLAALLMLEGKNAFDGARYAEARRLCAEGLAVARRLNSPETVARCLFNLAAAAREEGDYRAARDHAEECLALCQQTDYRPGTAQALQNLGQIAQAEGDRARALHHYEQSLAVYRQLGHRECTARLLRSLASVAREQGDDAEARGLLDESLAICRAMGHQAGIAASLQALGELAQTEGGRGAV